ncbi:MAG: hypothetical protein ACRDBF_15105, partial [Plesiomonas shigelloides]
LARRPTRSVQSAVQSIMQNGDIGFTLRLIRAPLSFLSCVFHCTFHHGIFRDTLNITPYSSLSALDVAYAQQAPRMRKHAYHK